MNEIKNYITYTGEMTKSCEDKLFFLDYITDANTVIDFGCANGMLLKIIREKFPTLNLIGIDCDSKMLNTARENVKKCDFINDTTIPLISEEITKKAVLNMSSVIHEIYAYSSVDDVERFWNDVFDSGYKYISIRDLMLASNSYRPAQPKNIKSVKEKANQRQLKEFEKQFGNISSQHNLIHFLMKYRYVENWSREVEENYFPIMIEEFLSKIPTNRYRIIYFKHYPLPFNQRKIYEDFGIVLNDNTHIKILLERR